MRWVKRLRWLPAVLVTLALSITLVPISTAQADTGGWSGPIQLAGSPTVGGWFPAVAADDVGGVYVVWQASYPTKDPFDLSALFVTRWDGRAWSSPRDIAVDSPAGIAIRSALAASPDGMVHLIYKGLGTLDAEVLSDENLWFTSAPGQAAADVHAWRSPNRLTRFGQGYFSDLAIDRHGTIHALWTESVKGTWGLFYARSTDGGHTWSDATALDTGEPVWWYRAHLTADARGRLHAVWEVIDSSMGNDSPYGYGTTLAAGYAISTDGGITWTRLAFTSSTAVEPYSRLDFPALDKNKKQAGPQQPAIGVDGQGRILLVFREPATNHILYRTSSDGTTWSGPTALPGVREGVARPFDIYDMATDSAGHVHLVLVGYPGTASAMSLLHLEWNGQQWSDPQIIATGPPYPEYPRIAIGEGNRLHVVWFGGNKPTTDREPVGIWYSTAQTNAPPVIVRATASPPAQASPAPVLPPSALPAPLDRRPAASPRVPAAPDAPVQRVGLLAALERDPNYPLVISVATVVPVLAIAALGQIAVLDAVRRWIARR